MSIATFDELRQAVIGQDKTIWELTQEEEAVNADVSVEEVRKEVLRHIVTMRETIKTGMGSTEKSVSEWCGDDCEKLIKRYSEHRSLFGTTLFTFNPLPLMSLWISDFDVFHKLLM